MSRDHIPAHAQASVSRRTLLQATAAGIAGSALSHELLAAFVRPGVATAADKRFPHFESTPVSYFDVKMQDTFWAPRQKVVRDVTVAWATRHFDEGGGLEAFKANPQQYVTRITPGDLEAIKFVEAMATVVGLQRDVSIEGLTQAWAQQMISAQEPGGYWLFGWPLAADPVRRWQPVWWSHEDYALGHYVEAALAYRESTGVDAMYESAVRAVDNMASTLLSGNRSYAPGHEEIEQALMRLYGATGNPEYLQLCGWLFAQRGHHEGRRGFGKYSQDHLPINEQRTIEGHAVRAAFLFNGVTEYVGATGDAGYREAVLAIWNDFVNHKMYLHGAGGNQSAENEGYSSTPDFISPGDCYGESCSVVGNFQWAHNLFRLTGDAAYLDIAERMLYNAFYASLSLAGDRYCYRNLLQQDDPTSRHAWHLVPCCPPNIVKLFSKIGGFFYSRDKDGVFVKHYGACEASLPFGHGVKLIQHTNYPWSGDVTVQVEPRAPTEFTLNMRVPAWAKSSALTVNGKAVNVDVRRGWLSVRRKWQAGDTLELRLPMKIERVTMPARFKEYANLVAIQRGPIVYCLEEQDIEAADPFKARAAYLPHDASITAEHRPEFLGSVTVLRTNLQLQNIWDRSEMPVSVTFIPYGVWNNRTPGAMRVWLRSCGSSADEALRALPENPPGSGR